MRRLNEQDSLTRNLGAIAYGVCQPSLAALSLPDPAEQIRQSRLKAEKEAQAEGLSRGLAEAQKQIDSRVQAIEDELKRKHGDALKALEETRTALSALIDGLREQSERLLGQSEEVAVETAYRAVLKLLGDQAVDGALMRRICQQALASAEEAPTALRLSIEDRASLGDEWTDITLIGDVRFARGQCALETRMGHYETGLDVRLEALKNAFLDGLQQYRTTSP